jgi:glycerate kinase
MGDAGHVVAAPDKFKGTLTAAQAAAHIAAGLRAARPGLPVRQVPVADGGDGTVAAAVAAGYQPVRCTVRGPGGQPVDAWFAWRDGTAIIEAAQACGLSRLPGGALRPLTATSLGVGDLIAAAVARGARRLVLGLGGVASTDGGAGLMQALGARLLDAGGHDLPPGGAALAGLARLDLTAFAPPAAEVLVASDVDNPLLGRRGAAAVYGPQKGASPAEVRVLDSALTCWADLTERLRRGPSRSPGAAPGQPASGRARWADQPGAGAAGGLGYAALAFLGAGTRPGIELMLELTGFAAQLAGARLVVTGEGSLDTQTLHGKAPAGVARAAAKASREAALPMDALPVAALPVVAVAGRNSLSPGQLRAAGLAAAYALTDIEPDPERCLAEAGPLLERAAGLIAADWLPAGPA